MTLTCPQPSNLAAIAKQLHATALQAEADIYVSEQAMRASVNRPTVVVTTNAPQTTLVANQDNIIFPGLTTYDNTAGSQGAGSGSFTPASANFATFLGDGLYEIGLCATATASGVVDNNSVRAFSINHMRPNPATLGGFDLIQRAPITQFETNTGVGTEVAIVGHFRLAPFDEVRFILYHENTSSTLTIATGAIMYATKMSDPTLTRIL